MTGAEFYQKRYCHLFLSGARAAVWKFLSFTGFFIKARGEPWSKCVGFWAREDRGHVLFQHVDTLTHPLFLFLSLSHSNTHTHTCTDLRKSWQSDTITTQQIAVRPAVGPCASCLSIRTTALDCLLCSFSGVHRLHMQSHNLFAAAADEGKVWK